MKYQDNFFPRVSRDQGRKKRRPLERGCLKVVPSNYIFFIIVRILRTVPPNTEVFLRRL